MLLLFVCYVHFSYNFLNVLVPTKPDYFFVGGIKYRNLWSNIEKSFIIVIYLMSCLSTLLSISLRRKKIPQRFYIIVDIELDKTKYINNRSRRVSISCSSSCVRFVLLYTTLVRIICMSEDMLYLRLRHN